VEPAKAGGLDLDGHDRAQRLLVQPDLLDRARGDARDLEVRALDQAEGVVELDLVRAGGALLLGAGGNHHEPHRGEHHEA
jgi:hypothetical protein